MYIDVTEYIYNINEDSIVSAMMLFCNRISFAQVRIEQMYSDINMPCVGMACVFFVK